jgi:hypothetical protein
MLLAPEEPEIDPRPYIQCTAQNDTVGKKNITLATGFYQARSMPSVTVATAGVVCSPSVHHAEI